MPAASRKQPLAVVGNRPAPYGREYRRIECDLPKYKGFWAEFWVDYPMGIMRDIGRLAENEGEDAMMGVFRDQPLIRAWNIVDYDGADLPIPSEDPESFYKIPSPLMQWVFRTIGTAPGLAAEDDDLPNSSEE